jgi:phosphoribosylformylglycinamidine synthase
MTSYRFAVDVMPRDGILDPQGRAVEASLPQLGVGVATVNDVRVGRRVELSVRADSEEGAREVVEQIAADFLANPLVEKWSIEALR